MKRANVLAVLKWEFNKHIKSPVFLLITFLVPAIIALTGFLPGFIMSKTSVEEKALWVLDETGELAPILETTFAHSRFNLELVAGGLDEQLDRLDSGKTEALLHISEQTLTTGKVQLYVKDMLAYQREELLPLIQPAFTQHRLQVLEISPEEYALLFTPASLEFVSVSGEKENIFAFIIPLAAATFLFISILFSGQILMQSVIKEKRSRIVEILLSSVSATELLAGKVLAFGALALVQIGIWLGVGLSVLSHFIDLREVGLDAGMIFKALPYFLLGHLMLSTLSAAMAATMKDAESGSQAHGLVFLLPMLPLMMSPPMLMAPNGFFARLCSFIPIFTPAAMLLRIGVTKVAAWEIAATSSLLLLATYFFLKLGARIFSGSLLKFDGAASIREIMGMARNKG